MSACGPRPTHESRFRVVSPCNTLVVPEHRGTLCTFEDSGEFLVLCRPRFKFICLLKTTFVSALTPRTVAHPVPSNRGSSEAGEFSSLYSHREQTWSPNARGARLARTAGGKSRRGKGNITRSQELSPAAACRAVELRVEAPSRHEGLSRGCRGHACRDCPLSSSCRAC